MRTQPTVRRAFVPHRGAAAANALYGHGYRPDLPSILSVAHDETDGGRLYVIVDRPCRLVASGLTLPLSVAGLAVLAAEMVLPVKLRLTMNGAVPAGSAWAWGTGASDLRDVVTNAAPNAGQGACDDAPGPYVPPAPAAVVEALASGSTATLRFDKVIILVGPAPVVPDDAVTFDGNPATAVSGSGSDTLQFDVPGGAMAGMAWSINRQPAWAATSVANPTSGNLS